MPLLWNKTLSTVIQENCRHRGKICKKEYVLGLSEICLLNQIFAIHIFFILINPTILIPVLKCEFKLYMFKH